MYVCINEVEEVQFNTSFIISTFLAAAPDTNLDRPPPGAELLGASRSGRLQKATLRTFKLCRPLRLERKQTGIREEQDQ